MTDPFNPSRPAGIPRRRGWLRNASCRAPLVRAALALAALVPLVPVEAPGDVRRPDSSDESEGGPASPPPSPFEIGPVAAVRGKPVVIELRAVTGILSRVEFLLRDRPGSGRVSAPSPLPREGEFNRASVVYTPDPNGTATADMFTYAARLPGGVPSSKVAVNIVITEPTPDLHGPDSVSFGEVLIGQSRTRTVALTNEGSGVFTGEVTSAPPWTVRGGAVDLRVEPGGGTAEFEIAFAPVRVGSESIALQFDNAAGGGAEPLVIGFAGTGVAPFVVSPPELEIEPDAGTGERKGELVLRNAVDLPLVVAVTGGEGLGIPELLPVDAKAHRSVPFEIDASPERFRRVVRFSGDGHVAEVVLTSPPLPGRVEVVGGSGPGAGGAPVVIPPTLPGVTRSGSVIVKNVGGDAAAVIAQVSAPFSVDDDDRSFTLAAGESRNVDVAVLSRITGDFDRPLKLFCNGHETEVGVQASVVNQLPGDDPPPAVATSALDGGVAQHSSGAREPGGNGLRGTAGLNDEERFKHAILFQRGVGATRETTEAVPRVQRLDIVERDRDSVTLRWEEPEGGPYSYEFEIERLVFFPQQQLPVKLWLTYEKVNFESEGDVVTATLEDLKTGVDYRWRLLTHRDGLGWSMPSLPFTAGTIIPGKWPLKWIALGLLAVAFGGWWWWNRRAEYT